MSPRNQKRLVTNVRHFTQGLELALFAGLDGVAKAVIFQVCLFVTFQSHL